MSMPNLRVQALYLGYVLTSFIGIRVSSSCVPETLTMCPHHERDGTVPSSGFLWSKKDRNSVNECVVDCYGDQTCHAIFYNDLTLVCQGYTSSSLSTANAVSEPGWRHYLYCLQKDCTDAHFTGIFTVTPSDGLGNIPVFCDMQTDGGGWLVFQRRRDGSENFAREWEDFKSGFGFLGNEFWLGNDYIHRLTSQRTYTLRIDLEDFQGNTCWSTFTDFHVNSEDDLYRITIGGYTGQCGDSLSEVSGNMFTTIDRDNDISSSTNCAETYPGGWWFYICHDAHLNGQYNNTEYAAGICWADWKGLSYTLKASEMKIRPR